MFFVLSVIQINMVISQFFCHYEMENFENAKRDVITIISSFIKWAKNNNDCNLENEWDEGEI